MIPLTQEQDWLFFLKEYPTWEPPALKTIVLSPHPDDETLGAGGLIASLSRAKTELIIIAITDGENAYPEVNNLRQIRQKEQELAVTQLGLSHEAIIRLGLVDSAVPSAAKQLEQLLLPFVNETVHLIAPWVGDFHCDHQITGQVAMALAEKTGAQLSFYFFWTWHYVSHKAIKHLPLSIYPLSAQAHQAKRQALNCYESQLSYDKNQPILPKRFLAPAYRHFEVYCPYSYGVKNENH